MCPCPLPGGASFPPDDAPRLSEGSRALALASVGGRGEIHAQIVAGSPLFLATPSKPNNDSCNAPVCCSPSPPLLPDTARHRSRPLQRS